MIRALRAQLRAIRLMVQKVAHLQTGSSPFTPFRCFDNVVLWQMLEIHSSNAMMLDCGKWMTQLFLLLLFS